MSIVIAVDGTAASGKGTLAKKLARHFSFAHLDSGSLYRLVALSVLETGGDPATAAKTIDLSRMGDAAIRSDRVGKKASEVSAIPEVRAALFQFQRDFASEFDAVIDGRDIGTVICPEATAKLFVDAHPEKRAHRRWLELENLGIARDEKELLAELLVRDARDRDRPISPMRPAADALYLDTTDLNIEDAFYAALSLIDRKVRTALEQKYRPGTTSG